MFSGAAAARQAVGDTIMGNFTASGFNLDGTLSGSPFTQLAFLPGSNDAYKNITSPGANCQILITNGHAVCNYPTAVTSTVVNLTISGVTPTAIGFQVVYADTTTGTSTAPVTPASGACDWLVQFNTAPQIVSQAPIRYGVEVTNSGNGSCPAADLHTSAAFISKAFGTASVAPVSVPALAPGGTVVVYPTVKRVELATRAYDWLFQNAFKHPLLHVSATMPQDPDQGSDESASTITEIATSTVPFKFGGHHTLDARCPGTRNGPCKFDLYAFTAAPKANQPPRLIGSGDGTIPSGKTGHIPFRFNAWGDKALKKHKLTVVFGINTQSGVESFIEGRATLH
jgi:hypothetical protein